MKLFYFLPKVVGNTSILVQALCALLSYDGDEVLMHAGLLRPKAEGG